MFRPLSVETPLKNNIEELEKTNFLVFLNKQNKKCSDL